MVLSERVCVFYIEKGICERDEAHGSAKSSEKENKRVEMAMRKCNYNICLHIYETCERIEHTLKRLLHVRQKRADLRPYSKKYFSMSVE